MALEILHSEDSIFTEEGPPITPQEPKPFGDELEAVDSSLLEAPVEVLEEVE